MRRAALSLAGACALAASLLGCRFGGGEGEEHRDVPTVAVEHGTFRETVEDVGLLRATRSQELKAQSWGLVSKVVNDGTPVQAGDPVIWMDTAQLDQELARLDADLADTDSQMQKQLERMSFQTKSADFDLRVSKANMEFEQERLASASKEAEDAERQRGLGLISQQAADRATEKLRSARLSAEKARLAHEVKLAQVDSERRQIEVQRQEAQRTWGQTRQRRDEVQKQLDQAVLVAPAAGTVFLVKQRFRGAPGERFVRTGDQVGPWIGALAQIPDRSAFEVRSQVDEALVSRIQVGMPVEVRVTAVEGVVLKGKVKSVAVLAIARSQSEGAGFLDAKQGAVEAIVFPVTIDLTDADPKLQPGMTVGVSYVLAIVEDATSVPDDAVFGTAAAPVVFVRVEKGWREQPVTLGAASNGRVVITSGLSKGDVVYLGDPRQTTS